MLLHNGLYCPAPFHMGPGVFLCVMQSESLEPVFAKSEQTTTESPTTKALQDTCAIPETLAWPSCFWPMNVVGCLE